MPTYPAESVMPRLGMMCCTVFTSMIYLLCGILNYLLVFIFEVGPLQSSKEDITYITINKNSEGNFFLPLFLILRL